LTIASSEPLKIDVDAVSTVSALWMKPRDAFASFVFAHGAGAGMGHPFMEAVASGLYKRRIATLRYQFPYMERGRGRPDVPRTAHATVRAAGAEAARLGPDLPIIAGGKSFGARMTSQAQAARPLAAVKGLCFFGFPLHPAGKPSDARGKHLSDIHVPMLFLQGDRDKLAELSLVQQVGRRLGERAALRIVEHADHSFTCQCGRERQTARSWRGCSTSLPHVGTDDRDGKCAVGIRRA
jgi:predicted alpha/beta-hydrolase family hydrolase